MANKQDGKYECILSSKANTSCRILHIITSLLSLLSTYLCFCILNIIISATRTKRRIHLNWRQTTVRDWNPPLVLIKISLYSRHVPAEVFIYSGVISWPLMLDDTNFLSKHNNWCSLTSGRYSTKLLSIIHSRLRRRLSVPSSSKQNFHFKFNFPLVLWKFKEVIPEAVPSCQLSNASMYWRL